jgi:hypothetical protein
MHYLFADLLGMSPSPEIDRDKLRDNGVEKTYTLLKHNRIPKFHRATYWDIESAFGDNKLKVLGVVRNPRDRGVSLSFHNRYHKNHHFKQKDFETDEESVKYTILNDKGYKKGNLRQLSLMIPGHYILNNLHRLYSYVWVDYSLLLNKTAYCVDRIVKLLDLDTSKDIENVVENHSFVRKSNRKPGEEKRSDLWRRKGIVGDWTNWFDDELYLSTLDDTNNYETLMDEHYWG